MNAGSTEQKKGLRQYLEMVTGSLAQKKQWREYKARTRRLPDNYRVAVDALERYLVYFGPSGDMDSLQSMLDDLVELFEQSAADGTSIRTIVGEDPVDFAEEFIRTYQGSSWINKERGRLTKAIERAAGEDSGNGGKANS